MRPAFDLHVHTTASDGQLPPAETVRRAKAQELLCVAVTDHDTTAGVISAIAEGRRIGLPVIAGAEFSAGTGVVSGEAGSPTPLLKGGSRGTIKPPGQAGDFKELHILGYGMDIGCPAYLAFVREQQERRKERNERMLARLAGMGVTMPEEYAPGAVPGEYGRKHMALGLEKAGYASSVDEAFRQFLAPGAPAYVPRRKFSAGELIDAIRSCGGQAVLAHPCRTELAMDALQRLVSALAQDGLAGVEAYYPMHTPEEAEAYRRLASRHGLVSTYGSDSHGFGRPELAQGFFGFDIPDETYRWLHSLIRSGGF